MEGVLCIGGAWAFLCAVVLIGAARLSSRMSQRNIVVQPGPQPGKRAVVVRQGRER
jgi:hypothetical protein